MQVTHSVWTSEENNAIQQALRQAFVTEITSLDPEADVDAALQPIYDALALLEQTAQSLDKAIEYDMFKAALDECCNIPLPYDKSALPKHFKFSDDHPERLWPALEGLLLNELARKQYLADKKHTDDLSELATYDRDFLYLLGCGIKIEQGHLDGIDNKLLALTWRYIRTRQDPSLGEAYEQKREAISYLFKQKHDYLLNFKQAARDQEEAVDPQEKEEDEGEGEQPDEKKHGLYSPVYAEKYRNTKTAATRFSKTRRAKAGRRVSASLSARKSRSSHQSKKDDDDSSSD